VGGKYPEPELAKNLISLGQAVDLILLEFSRVAAEFAQTDEYDLRATGRSCARMMANS